MVKSTLEWHMDSFSLAHYLDLLIKMTKPTPMPKSHKRPRTSEELVLLLNYLALLGIWFAIPSVNLLLNRDKRWTVAISILGFLAFLICIAYVLQWDVLFPKSAGLIPISEDPTGY